MCVVSVYLNKWNDITFTYAQNVIKINADMDLKKKRNENATRKLSD